MKTEQRTQYWEGFSRGGGGVRQTSVAFVRLARRTGEEHPKWRDQHLLRPRGRMK